jgi:5-methylcytosine-specific restriction endonuclease McrA
MCQKEGTSLQRGMNFRLKGCHSVILMSVRPNSPYRDEVQEDGFDHILPLSKGGTSLKAENIQLLCARHNLSKSAKIL